MKTYDTKEKLVEKISMILGLSIRNTDQTFVYTIVSPTGFPIANITIDSYGGIEGWIIEKCSGFHLENTLYQNLYFPEEK